MKKIVLAALFLTALLLAAGGCFSPWQGGEAEVVLNLGGSASTARTFGGYPPDDNATREALKYIVEFTNSAEKVKFTGKDLAQPIKVRIRPGSWDIHVELTLNGEEYAAGGANNVEIKQGRTNAVSISMQEGGSFDIYIGGYSAPGGLPNGDYRACYWKIEANSVPTKYDLHSSTPSPQTQSTVSAITVVDGVVYAAGNYQNSYGTQTACY